MQNLMSILCDCAQGELADSFNERLISKASSVGENFPLLKNIPPPPGPRIMSESELIDLEEIVRDYASSFLDSDQKKHADLKNPIINWDRMFVTHGEAKYAKPMTPPMPVSHVLFSAVFANNTPKPQTYALRTERHTKSSCNVTFAKTYSFGVAVSMRLTPPNPIIEANSGFKSDLTESKGQSQTFERELMWAVDNSITVPPGFQTKAELVIKEDNFNGEFEVPCYFEGTIVVTYENKKREHVATVRDHVKKFFKNQQGFTTDEKGRPMFKVRGCCKCRFGVEQSVRLTETPLDDEDERTETKAIENAEG
ncbi:Lin-24 (twenty-four) like [Plakobranchus ocellatus]|uniref:Lin-24 (Twenty-four) like n=1 Tax=Plakobranchus ocellatus TaxID=259542 RepID=A0AAV3ZE05_9GAST|nr:Lin-24 (twenty-four) like [Plakobranchus ocellatus]